MSDSNPDPKNHRAQGADKKPTPEPDFTIPDPVAGSDIGGGTHDRRPRGWTSLPVFGGANWLILWLVITLGVTSGNLLSNYITSLAIGYQLRAAFSSLSQDAEKASARIEQDLQASAERRAAEQRQQRKESDRGQKLARQCNEWRNAHRELDTYTTGQNVERYCGAYHEYVQTGRATLD